MLEDHGHDDGDVDYELAVPFTVCASNGGPFEDGAYVAGYEMGLLAGEFNFTTDPAIEQVIRTDNVTQADLLAMHYGWKLESRPDAIYGSEWSHIRCTRIDGRDAAQ